MRCFICSRLADFFQRLLRGTYLLGVAFGLLGCAYGAPLEPTVSSVSYGPHANQMLDLYLPEEARAAESATASPVLVWYGGIWKPARHAADPGRFLKAGIAVVAVGTRTLTDGMNDRVAAPVAYVMDDACRAVQFLRLNAAKWHLDSGRFVVGGSSQGSLPALYVGCSPDRAQAESEDPLLRQSTRVLGVVAHRSQPSIDPVQMQAWVPGVKWGAPALGMDFDQSLARRQELLPLINRWSPEALLHAGAAPMYFENNWGLTQPEGVGLEDYKVHSPAWALGFQKKAQAVGAACYVKYPGHATEGVNDFGDFIIQTLTGAAKP